VRASLVVERPHRARGNRGEEEEGVEWSGNSSFSHHRSPSGESARPQKPPSKVQCAFLLELVNRGLALSRALSSPRFPLRLSLMRETRCASSSATTIGGPS